MVSCVSLDSFFISSNFAVKLISSNLLLNQADKLIMFKMFRDKANLQADDTETSFKYG
jgi:hypothetical protein